MKSDWRLFLDQNIRIEVNIELRENAIDSIHATDVHLQQALDSEILQYAIHEKRVLVTRDADFGDLNISPLPADIHRTAQAGRYQRRACHHFRKQDTHQTESVIATRLASPG